MDVAVSMVQEAQALYPELRACSFDRGFHSRDNRVRLDALLDVNALPGRGYLSRADREREEEESFVAARRAHPAIESAINGLEHRGLDRVRSHGADGFARTVALSVLAANLHRIGLILQKLICCPSLSRSSSGASVAAGPSRNHVQMPRIGANLSPKRGFSG